MVNVIQHNTYPNPAKGGKDYYTGGKHNFVGMFQMIIRVERAAYKGNPVWSDLTPEEAGFERFLFYSTATNTTPVTYFVVDVFTRMIESTSPELYLPYTNSAYITETLFDEQMIFVDGINVRHLNERELPYGGVSTRPGDYVFTVSSNTATGTGPGSRPIDAPEGYAVLSAYGTSGSQHTIAWKQTDVNGTTTPPAILSPGGSAYYVTYPTHATISMRPTSPVGIPFQIMHNGQLIPATPNLWSGGQLTPVALNLPE